MNASEKLIGGALGALMISDAAFIKPVKENIRIAVSARVISAVECAPDQLERVLTRVTHGMLDFIKAVALEDVVEGVYSSDTAQVFYSLFDDMPVRTVNMPVTGFKDEAEANERIITLFAKAITSQYADTFNATVDDALKALKRGQL